MLLQHCNYGQSLGHDITLEQVHATILYYLHNQETVSAYLADWLAWSHQMRKQQQENLAPFIEKLRALKAKKQVVAWHT